MNKINPIDSHHTSNEKFIPTMEEWNLLFAKWHKKMAKSLWKSGDEYACEEAVQEAFLKILGLSDHLHLEEPLTPKAEGCWYSFIRYQAKGILSKYHQHQHWFVEFKEYDSSATTSVDGGWTRTDADDAAWDVSAVHRDAMDVDWLKQEVRKVVSEVCRRAGRSERDIKVYIGYVLDEKSPDEILSEVKNLCSASNLYRIASQIKDILIASREHFRDAYNELVAA